MKRTNRSALKWLLAVPGRKQWYIVFLTLLQMLLGATGVFYALLLKRAVDTAVRHDAQLFWRSSLLLVLLLIVQQTLQAMVRWMNELTRASLENVLKERLTAQILKKDYAAVSGLHSGEWMNRMTNDTVVVTTGYVDILPGVAGTVVRLVTAVGALALLQPGLTWIILAGALVILLFSATLKKKMKSLHKNVQEEDGRVRAFLQECLASLMVIKSFTAEKQTLQQAAERMEDHKSARMRRNRWSNLLNTGFSAGMEGVYVFAAVYCAYGILTGSVSYGTMMAVTQLAGQIRAPFAYISGYLPKYYSMLASAERLMQIEEYPEDLTEPLLTKEEIADFYGQQLEAFGLYDADYRYRPVGTELADSGGTQMPPVLRGFSLEVRKGEYVAFTGHSGCGKSTVLKLLMCLYGLDGGTRSIRRRDGTSVLLTAAWRRLFAYVPQGNLLMTGTIRETVSFSEAETDEERLRRSLQIACADEFVAELPEGPDSRLGERGAGLSEGQMQRLAIARAVYAGAPVLLLDEATSALDERTEEKLLRNLRELTDRTVIIVTHRPAALAICDRVLRFTEDGVKEI